MKINFPSDEMSRLMVLVRKLDLAPYRVIFLALRALEQQLQQEGQLHNDEKLRSKATPES